MTEKVVQPPFQDGDANAREQMDDRASRPVFTFQRDPAGEPDDSRRQQSPQIPGTQIELQDNCGVSLTSRRPVGKISLTGKEQTYAGPSRKGQSPPKPAPPWHAHDSLSFALFAKDAPGRAAHGFRGAGNVRPQRRRSRSPATKNKNTTEITPFMVKNAALSFERSSGETSECS